MNSKYFIAFTRESSCCCPLNSLSPTEIKKIYSDELKNDSIQISTYYNQVSNALGFKDWTKYLKEYDVQILPFLTNNGLKKYAPMHDINILQSKHKNIYFTYRQIADRIFLSDKESPLKIFTGYGCNIDYINFYQMFSNWGFDKDFLDSFIQSGEYCSIVEEQELDYLIPIISVDFTSLMNLIGDTFIIDTEKNHEYVSTTYYNKIGLYDQERMKGIAQVVHEQFKAIKKGWLEVIPFNENLVFLKAHDGSYDFIFKGLRDTSFTSEFNKYIKSDNIPSLVNENYDFERWLYFGFQGKQKDFKKIELVDIWLEREQHLAEIMYYENYISGNYPGVNKILKDYFIKNKKYSYYKKPTNKVIEGFKTFELENSLLHVSDLITINDFLKFSQDKVENLDKNKTFEIYAESRRDTLEELSVVNYEEINVPISVTWYDAIAYCRYLENKYNIRARLLTPDEYEIICPKPSYKEYDKNDSELLHKYQNDKEYSPFANDVQNELSFSYKDKQLPSPPTYMEDFDKVVMKFAKPLDYIEHNGLKFCINTVFHEWTNQYYGDESQVVSARYPDYKELSGFTLFKASSTMKYKYRKVGFRVCYETLKDA